jgi:ABC-type branched-subunit amino acid transport system ATPase component
VGIARPMRAEDMTLESALAQDTGDAPVLRVRDLSVRYAAAVDALRDVSLDIPAGAIVSVLGGNGAGKSTLLRAISGSLAAQRGTVTAGSIVFEGRDITRSDAAELARSGLVQVPEGRRIFSRMTVEENLRAGGMAARDRAARERAKAWVDELFPILVDRGGQRAGLLSGGEQQMLAIGRALMAGPRVLLMDEPSLGLAPQIVDRIGEVIREINRQGVTVVLVEQNAAMALAVSRRALVLENGAVVLEGEAADLARNPEVQDRYLGVGTANAPRAARRPSATTSARALEVDDVTVRFGGLTALAGVSFEVAPGTTHALIGPNGAGKSTMVGLISGMIRPSAGTIHFAGQETTRLAPYRIARLGVTRTFQLSSEFTKLTVLENLLVAVPGQSGESFLGAIFRARRWMRQEREMVDQARALLARFEMTAKEEEYAGNLSGGQKRLVEIMRGLMAKPKLLLLDEPLAGVNPTLAHQILGYLEELRDEGLTMLMVEHDLHAVGRVCEPVVVMAQGKVLAQGPLQELRANEQVRNAYLIG